MSLQETAQFVGDLRSTFTALEQLPMPTIGGGPPLLLLLLPGGTGAAGS